MTAAGGWSGGCKAIHCSVRSAPRKVTRVGQLASRERKPFIASRIKPARCAVL
uniref:Uncharacterized protein n=1 Tax=Anguilla anguilla TaxID=7936 RepID=A0A0E9W431_ANGAN